MKINKLDKISSRSFKGFRWPSDLDDFKSRNLIYGWNGSGKSTLSDLFRSIEKKLSLENECFTIITENCSINSLNIPEDVLLPQVRVFNKKYIEENVFNSRNEVTAIFYLGQENIEKQKEVGKCKEHLRELNNNLENKRNEVEQKESALDKYYRDEALKIKDILRSSDKNNQFNNYDKGNFKHSTRNFSQNNNVGEKILDDDNFNKYKDIKESNIKEVIDLVRPIQLDFDGFRKNVEGVLSTLVVTKILNELKSDNQLSEWVKVGLGLHKEGNSYKKTCSFCKNDITNDRLKVIENHFNESYRQLQRKIIKLIEDIKKNVDSLKSIDLPHKSEFYDDIEGGYDTRRISLNENIELSIKWFEYLKEKLNEKNKNLFLEISLENKVFEEFNLSVDDVNMVVDNHNQRTRNFNEDIKNARVKIEEHLVASCLDEYKLRNRELLTIKLDIKKLEGNRKILNGKIYNLELSIRDHLPAAEELNKDIKSYLGRDEIKFKTQENGYQIIRGNTPAENLSEGEKTAIAFLHFLKSLSDQGFTLPNGVVVIDDPVSSLDANSIYHAFGFMKERTKESGQLFILTHNYTLFRLVKNWFKYENNNNVSSYMLSLDNNDLKESKISKLDTLLENFESEYHFLFSIIYNNAYKNCRSLSSAYPLPNIARRLLESFFAFKRPCMENLYKKIASIDFDDAKKSQILRFVDTYSHSSHIGGLEYDPSILQESFSILRNVLELIEYVDKGHFKLMKSLVINGGM